MPTVGCDGSWTQTLGTLRVPGLLEQALPLGSVLGYPQGPIWMNSGPYWALWAPARVSGSPQSAPTFSPIGCLNGGLLVFFSWPPCKLKDIISEGSRQHCAWARHQRARDVTRQGHHGRQGPRLLAQSRRRMRAGRAAETWIPKSADLPAPATAVLLTRPSRRL